MEKRVKIYASGKLIPFENALKVCGAFPNPPTFALYPFLLEFRKFVSTKFKNLKISYSCTEAVV